MPTVVNDLENLKYKYFPNAKPLVGVDFVRARMHIAYIFIVCGARTHTHTHTFFPKKVKDEKK